MKNKIKEMRKEKKITQDELAKVVHVTRQTIISLENGRYNASLQLAHKIAKYFVFQSRKYLYLRRSKNGV